MSEDQTDSVIDEPVITYHNRAHLKQRRRQYRQAKEKARAYRDQTRIVLAGRGSTGFAKRGNR